MPSYKLYYFDARGRAEVVRLMFAAKDVEYEDVRIPKDQWLKYKAETPFGQVPVLEIDGQKYAQSTAIYSYVARELGFYGKTNLDKLGIDQVVQLQNELVTAGAKHMMERDEAKKAELQKNFREVQIPKYMELFNKLLADSGTGYFVGRELTLADIVVFDSAFQIDNVLVPGTLAKYPKVQALYDNVMSNTKIRNHVTNRKQTPF